MKEPKISELRIDHEGTKSMRKKALESKKIKITINFDADVLERIKELAKDRGTPYQMLLNRLVKESSFVRSAPKTTTKYMRYMRSAQPDLPGICVF